MTNEEPILGYNPELVSISNSEMQTFKRCRRRWWLEYYRGLKPNEEKHTGPLKLGIRLHNALELFYKDDAPLVDTYLTMYAGDKIEFMQSNASDDPKEYKKFTDEGELGRVMLEGYLEWLAETNADADMKITGIEEKLSYHLKEFDNRVEVIGKADLTITRTSDGSRAIFDHKSAVSFNDYYLHSDKMEQLMLYSLLQKLSPTEDQAPIDGGTFNLLRKVKRSATAKPPFYDRIDVRFNDDTLDSFWYRLLGVISDMMSVRDQLDAGANHKFVAYPTPKMDWSCAQCPFFKVCPMFDDGSDAEGMIDDYFHQVDPNLRYKEEKEGL